MTQYTRESHANMNHVRMQSNPLPCHATSNHIKTQNVNPKIAMQTLKNECNYHQMFVSQPDDHDMLCETYFHAH